MTGLLEATITTISDEMTAYHGLYATRVTTAPSAATQLQSAAQTLDYDGATTVTLTTSTFGASVGAGDVIRLLSGTLSGAEATIASGAGGTATAVLSAPFPGASGALTGLSWEVIRPADTEVLVESVLGWAASGQLRIDGVLYRYSATVASPAAIQGLEHWDTDQWVAGVKQAHVPLSMVLDWTRVRSAMEQQRQASFLATATGDDLTQRALEEGVRRPPELGDDTIFRAYAQAMAYGHKGGVPILDELLTALLGAGNYEIFEDLTKASEGDEPQHHNTVYFRRISSGTQPVGATYIEDTELAVSTSATTVDLARTPVAVTGVRVAPDKSEREVSTGEGAVSVDSGQSVQLLSGTWPTHIQRGDFFELTDGPNRGKRALVQTVTPTDLTLSVIQGQPNVTSQANGSLGFDFSGERWCIKRLKTEAMYYRPSEDQAAEYPGGPLALRATTTAVPRPVLCSVP